MKPFHSDENNPDRGPHPTGDPSNPYGLGDPNDQTLRKVEIEIMVPMKIRDKTKQFKCAELVKSFHDCCMAHGVMMVAWCRKENNEMKECMAKWYHDEEFKAECTQEYLQERSEYRRTGVKANIKRYVA